MMNSPLRAGLYVHLPWCVRKCPYCDFNSYEAGATIGERDYVDALFADLEHDLESSEAVEITSIFIGGGTPSLFSGAAIARLLEGVAARATVKTDVEITLETNPGAVDAVNFRDYFAAGVNRLSIGVQSFDDVKLKALGRIHTGADARRGIEIARGVGFDNLNLDLMFGLPGDVPGDSLVDLNAALGFEPEHLSWYQLTVEEGTAFARKRPALPGHDQICDDYDTGLERLARAGFEHYEISAHARAGRAARHNLNYWQFGDYIGIGAGAHGKRTGKDGIVRTAKIRHPARYVDAAWRGCALDREDRIDGSMRATEFMLNALRLKRGFTLKQFETRTGLSAATIARALSDGVQHGWLDQEGCRVWPTALGFRFLNDLQILFTDLRRAQTDFRSDR